MKIWKWIRCAIFSVLAVLVIIFAKELASEQGLRWFIGALICFYSIDPVVVAFVRKGKDIKKIGLASALVELVLGICTLVIINDYSTICVIWAVWSIMREAGELEEVFLDFKDSPIVTSISILESLLNIYFSITLILNPHESHALIHMYLLVVELITAVWLPKLQELIDYLKTKK